MEKSYNILKCQQKLNLQQQISIYSSYFQTHSISISVLLYLTVAHLPSLKQKKRFNEKRITFVTCLICESKWHQPSLLTENDTLLQHYCLFQKLFIQKPNRSLLISSIYIKKDYLKVLQRMSKRRRLKSIFDFDSEIGQNDTNQEKVFDQQRQYISQKKKHDRFQINRLQKNMFTIDHQEPEYDYQLCDQMVMTQPISFAKTHTQQKKKPELHQQNGQEEKLTKQIQKLSTIKVLMFDSSFSEQEEQEKSVDTKQYQSLSCLAEENISLRNNIIEKEKQISDNRLTMITPECMYQMFDKIQFSLSTIPKKTRLCCLLVNPPSFRDYLFPKYDLLFLQDYTHIMSCEKKMCSIGANFYFSVEKSKIEKNGSYLGKVREKNEKCYIIYGRNDKLQKCRHIIGTAKISRTPKLIELYILGSGEKYQNLKNSEKNIGLDLLYNFEENKQKIIKIVNKKSIQYFTTGIHTSNFSGRAQYQSKFNQILEVETTRQEVLMIGKSKDSIYRMDISYPLSPLIGFAFTIALFSSKK